MFLIILLVITVAVVFAIYDTRASKETPAQEQPPVVVPFVAAPMASLAEKPDFTPSPLVVRDLDDHKATLLVRYRQRRKQATAHLIVWAGKRKRNMQDSYYDLVTQSADSLSEEIIEKFVDAAMCKLDELKEAGKRNRQAKPSAVAATIETPVLVLPVSEMIDKFVDTSLDQMDERRLASRAEPSTAGIGDGAGVVKLRKYPNSVEGIYLESGMLPNDNAGKPTYGIKLRNPVSGIEIVRYGVHLKLAIEEAKAKPGDLVKVDKVGRKTMDADRAPMNLYEVVVLESARIAA